MLIVSSDLTKSEKIVIKAMCQLNRVATINEIASWSKNMAWITTKNTITGLMLKKIVVRSKDKNFSKDYYILNPELIKQLKMPKSKLEQAEEIYGRKGLIKKLHKSNWFCPGCKSQMYSPELKNHGDDLDGATEVCLKCKHYFQIRRTI
jgi:hypothetical protein